MTLMIVLYTIYTCTQKYSYTMYMKHPNKHVLVLYINKALVTSRLQMYMYVV